MKVYKGNILTVNKTDDVVKYLVEDKGRIVFVGDELPEKYASQKVTDLGDKALIPSFCDTHQHFASFSLFHAGLNVMDCSSNTEILQGIKEFSTRCKDKTLIAFGASPYSVEERRLVSREEIDSVCADKPVFMVKYDGHACVVNSALLKLVDKKVKGLRGYHPDTGEMNQEAFFAVSDYITGSIQIPALIRNMQKSVDYQASKGIGMIHTVSGVGFPMNMDISLEKWFARSVKSGFQIRVFPQSLTIKVATGRKLPRIGGCFECALDGCFGSHDASMIEPYVDELGGNGVLYYSDEKVTEFCKEANRVGLQIEMHAIGDKAFDQATRALKVALDDYPREDHRHGIIHDCIPTPEGMKICSDYHI
ncbi:MAG: amidohydrolase family protein, partial [Firmicutes bacterium]|nr:amidohydrolase family protein [Bacillota bacterium]